MLGFIKDFFSPRCTQNIDVGVNNGVIIQANEIGSINKEDIDFSNLLRINEQDIKLLNSLVNKELEKCEEYFYIGAYDKVLHITFSVFTYNPKNLDKNLLEKLYFYQFCAALINGNEDIKQASYDNIEGCLRDDADYILSVINLKEQIIVDVLLQKSKLVQKLIICLLYKKEHYKLVANLTPLYVDATTVANFEQKDFCSSICFIVGLCLYNCTNYIDSVIYLEKAYGYKADEKVSYYLECAKFFSLYTTKPRTTNIKKSLSAKYNAIIDIINKDNSLIEDNSEHWIWLSMHYYTFIEPQGFNAYFASIPEALKACDWIKHFRALYNISIKNYKESYDELCSIAESSDVIYLRTYCLLFLNEFDSIIKLYEQQDAEKIERSLRAIYFEALRVKHDEKLDKLAQREIDANLDIVSFIETFEIIGESKDEFNKYVLPFAMAHMNDIKHCEAFYLKSIYFYLLLKNSKDDVVLDLFNSFKQEELCGNSEFGYICYNALLNNTSLKQTTIITITSAFLQAGILDREYLSLRSDAYYKNNDIYEALKDIEIVFDLHQDLESAQKAIHYLLLLRNNNKESYAKYLRLLEKILTAESFSVLAVVYSHLKDAGLCIEYAYKSIYLLNGEMTETVADNYFRSFLGFAQHKARKCLKSVEENTVVTFDSLENEDHRLVVCLEHGDFYDNCASNNSFNVVHINENNPMYYNLLGKDLEDIFYIKGEKYKVSNIQDKYILMAKFMFDVHDREPEKFGSFLKSINFEGNEEFIKKIVDSLPDQSETFNLLKKYHMEDEDFPKISIPIDYISYHDYDKYIRVIKYLLFAKNEALYSGNCDCNTRCNKFVLSLSTLVILAIFNWLDLVQEFKENIIIPDTLLRFINDRRREAHDETRGGYLYKTDDGKLALEDNNELIRVWDAIYEACYGLSTFSVDESIKNSLKIQGQLSAESIMHSFGVASVQLDCFALAKQKQAVVMCDDMFLRLVGGSLGVISVNINYLLVNSTDYEKTLFRIEELSKSNYVFVNELLIINCLFNKKLKPDVFLDGERKCRFYIPYLLEIKKKLAVHDDK